MVQKRLLRENQRMNLLLQRVDRQHLVLKELQERHLLLAHLLQEEREIRLFRTVESQGPLRQESFQFQMLTPGRPEPLKVQDQVLPQEKADLLRELLHRSGQPTQPPTSPSSES